MEIDFVERCGKIKTSENLTPFHLRIDELDKATLRRLICVVWTRTIPIEWGIRCTDWRRRCDLPLPRLWRSTWTALDLCVWDACANRCWCATRPYLYTHQNKTASNPLDFPFSLWQIDVATHRALRERHDEIFWKKVKTHIFESAKKKTTLSCSAPMFLKIFL